MRRIITNIFREILIIVFVFLAGSIAAQTTFYVSNTGDDSNNGTSTSTPWKTISQVNSQSFIPGDSILFNTGDTWYEEIRINSSGETGNHIIYSSYGNGDKPRILGSVSITSWTNVTANIWKSNIETTDPSLGAPHNGGTKAMFGYPGGSWFEEKNGDINWGHQEKYIESDGDFDDLTAEYDWGWYNDYIYIYSTENPGMRYKSMQVSQRQTSIRMPNNNTQEYITIEGLELMFAQSKGFFGGYPEFKANGLNFFNCHIGYIGIKGAASAYGLSIFHSDMIIRENTINDCGRRGISYNLYTRLNTTYENIMVENNIFYGGYHTTSIDVSTLYESTIKNFTFRNNLVYEDTAATITHPEGFTSNSIYIAGANAEFVNFYIYNNIVINTTARSLLVANVDNIHVYNNTFYGLNRRARPYSMLVFSRDNTVYFKNNIIYGNMYSDVFDAYCLMDERGDTEYNELDYNLYYQEDPKQVFIGTNGGYYTMARWDYYKSLYGYDSHSPTPTDPLFVNGFEDLSLSENSPAIGVGDPITMVKTDFYGNAVNNPPDLGAIQFGSKPPPKDEDDDFSVKFVPNPAQNEVMISMKGDGANDKYFSVKFYNMTGKLVQESPGFLNNNAIISIANLSSGLYIVEVILRSSGVFTDKLIIFK